MGLFDGYLDTLSDVESGGKNIGSNTSSAFGPYQFLNSTWDNLIKAHPELGLSSQDRYNPVAQKAAAQAFTEDNAKSLQSAGLEPTNTNLYMTHFLGAGGGSQFLKALKENPNAPASQFVSPDAVAANRSVFVNPDGTPKTLGQVYSNFDRKFSGGSMPINSIMPSAPASNDEALTPPQDRLLELARAFSNQATTMPVHGYGDMIRGLAGVLLGNKYGSEYADQQKAYNEALGKRISGAAGSPLEAQKIAAMSGNPQMQAVALQQAMTPREADKIVKVGTDLITGGDLMKIQKVNPATGAFQLYELDGKTPYNPNGDALAATPSIGGASTASAPSAASGASSPQVTAQQAMNAGIHGEDFLKTLPPPIQTRVKAIANGDEVIQRGDKLGMQLANLAYQYDPTFNRTDAEARFNFKKSFTDPNHTNMKQALALNNMLHHGEQYMERILPNMPDNPISWGDQAAAWWGGLNKDPAYREAYTLGDFLGPESVKVASGAEGGEAERQAAAKRFYPEAGKSNISASLRTTAGVGEDKLKSLIDQWHAVMGNRPIPPEIINPRAREIFEKMKTIGENKEAPAVDKSNPYAGKQPGFGLGAAPQPKKLEPGKVYNWNPATGGFE
jgi:hypothetical protein